VLKSKGGFLRSIVFVVILVFVLGVLVFGLVYAKFPLEYAITSIFLTFGVLIILFSFLRLTRDTKRTDLIFFINSVSDLIKSWACVGRSKFEGYNAYCEFVDGYYVQFEQGHKLISTSGEEPCIVYVSKYLSSPELVFKAPIIKHKPDKNILKYALLPRKDTEVNKWKNSKEQWKRLVVEDEKISLWMQQYCSWINFRPSQPMPSEVFMVQIYGEQSYKRDPNNEGGWLKGKTLTIHFVFLPPATSELDEVRDYYTEMIDIGKGIIRHIEEDKAQVL